MTRIQAYADLLAILSTQFTSAIEGDPENENRLNYVAWRRMVEQTVASIYEPDPPWQAAGLEALDSELAATREIVTLRDGQIAEQNDAIAKLEDEKRIMNRRGLDLKSDLTEAKAKADILKNVIIEIVEAIRK